MNASDRSGPSMLVQYSPSRVWRVIRLGLRSLWLHRLRSLLTMLGMVFGVASVIAMLAVGEGASYETQQAILRLGSKNIIVESVKPPEDNSATSQRTGVVEYGVTHDDVRIMKSIVPGIANIVPARILREYVWRFDRKSDSEIIATTTLYPETRNTSVDRGRFFSETEEKFGASVCVLSAEVADYLFPASDPLGADVKIKEDYYRVIGVEEDRGKQIASATAGTGRRVYIPLTTAQTRFGDTVVKRRSGSFEAERVELHEMTIEVADVGQVIEISRFIGELLERNHKKKDYTITVPFELLIQAERTKRIFNFVLGAIAAISLLVGGIGIMNIMLASVTERTREIGIRRALGARRRDIVEQFLIETVLLSGVGGVLGVLVGIAVPFVISRISGVQTIVTLWSPLLAFSISAAVGLIFGLYPSIRAANMDPVEALRHE